MGSPIQKSEDTFSIALTVVKNVKSFKEDTYDKSITNVRVEEVQLASLDLAGANWETLKAKLHAHIDLI